MIATLLDNFFLLPSADRFIESVYSDLIERRCIIVPVPDTQGIDDFEYRLYSRLKTMLFDLEVVVLPDLNTDGIPVSALGERFDIQFSGALPTVENLLASDALPDYLCLTQFSQLVSSEKDKWLTFLDRWLTSAPPMGESIRPKPAMCIVIPAVDLTSRRLDSPQLSLRRWLGFPSALEMQVLCRFGPSDQKQQAAIARWKEHLIPSLAGTDLNYAAFLWDAILLPPDQLEDHALTYAVNRGWTPSLLREWKAVDFFDNNKGLHKTNISSLLNRYSLLWANGALTTSPEFGVELHTAALALLEQRRILHHRLWRGQLTLILPLIDMVRLAICDGICQEFKVELTEEESELGRLEYRLRQPQYRSYSAWLQVIQTARRIRNELAHYSPVTLNDYLSLIKASTTARLLI